ncbi:MAG: tautomerase family protein [Neptuniibacter sp.]
MPLVTYHLVEDQLTDYQSEQLLLKGAQLYADVLDSPVERVRGLINTYSAKRALVGGKVLFEGEQGAPYFEFIVLAGRPQEQIKRLMVGFTDLIVEVLGVDRSVIRGRCLRVEPDDWGIAGQFASELRAKEIQARADSEQA